MEEQAFTTHAPKCGARTRAGDNCQPPAPGATHCRMPGGATPRRKPRPGASRGACRRVSSPEPGCRRRGGAAAVWRFHARRRERMFGQVGSTAWRYPVGSRGSGPGGSTGTRTVGRTSPRPPCPQQVHRHSRTALGQTLQTGRNSRSGCTGLVTLNAADARLCLCGLDQANIDLAGSKPVMRTGTRLVTAVQRVLVSRRRSETTTSSPRLSREIPSGW